MFNLTLSSYRYRSSLEAQVQPDISHPCCDKLITVKTRYPLTSTTWPYRGLRYRPIEVEYFLRLSADKLLVFKWSWAQVQLFKCIGNKLCLWAALITFWFQSDLGRKISASFYRYGRQLLLTHHGHALATLYVQFVCSNWSKIWQVSSWGKFMQHLETCLLIAEIDRVLCHLVIFLTVFFHRMYKMKYSCFQDSSVIHVWFVYWVLVEKCAACQSHLKSDFGWNHVHLAWCVTLKRFWPYLMAFRGCISTGKPE